MCICLHWSLWICQTCVMLYNSYCMWPQMSICSATSVYATFTQTSAGILLMILMILQLKVWWCVNVKYQACSFTNFHLFCLLLIMERKGSNEYLQMNKYTTLYIWEVLKHTHTHTISTSDLCVREEHKCFTQNHTRCSRTAWHVCSGESHDSCFKEFFYLLNENVVMFINNRLCFSKITALFILAQYFYLFWLII